MTFTLLKSSKAIVNQWVVRLGKPERIPGRSRNLPFFAMRHPALGSEQFPIQGVKEGFPCWCKAAGEWSWPLGCFQCPVWKCLTIFFIICRRFQFLNKGEIRFTLFKIWPLTVLDVLLEIAVLTVQMGTAVAQWLRCCAANRKVAASIPGGVIGIFHWHKILPIALRPWGRLSL